ncbi:MAG: glycosyltransferase [Chloroflexi bacterium]|nr:glycosyltransferase [Chloroflexota bacterium]
MSISLDVVIPCLNEERALPVCIRRLHAFMSERMEHYDWGIVVADNGSTDGTLHAAEALSHEFPQVRYIRLEQRGRGRALRRAWTESRADIVAYMDVDLSTDLGSLPPMVAAIADDGYDVATGSRLLPDSQVVGRTLKREITSRGYSLLFRMMFFTTFRDAQCGFKAASRRAADDLAPLVEDNGWFFDSELLILAQKCGYPIKELPVHWEDDPDTRVRILRTAWEDVKGLLRLKFGGVARARRQLGAG